MCLAYYTHDLSPYLIEFGHGWGIRYYGLAYVLGFVILYFGLQYQAKRGWSRLSGPAIGDFVTYMAIFGVIVGGRLGYCLLYDFNRTMRDPFSIVRLENGGISGMASHGGIMGALLVIFFFARRKRIPFYNLADATALCTPLALGLGRLANFINGELWGRAATVPWAVIFPKAPLIDGVNVPRHPSQLYEASLEGALLFLLLWLIRQRTRCDGVVSLSFIALYAVLRIVGEQFREPDEGIGYWFGSVTQGQLLSAGMLLLAGVLAYFQFGRKASS